MRHHPNLISVFLSFHSLKSHSHQLEESRKILVLDVFCTNDSNHKNIKLQKYDDLNYLFLHIYSHSPLKHSVSFFLKNASYFLQSQVFS